MPTPQDVTKIFEFNSYLQCNLPALFWFSGLSESEKPIRAIVYGDPEKDYNAHPLCDKHCIYKRKSFIGITNNSCDSEKKPDGTTPRYLYYPHKPCKYHGAVWIHEEDLDFVKECL